MRCSTMSNKTKEAEDQAAALRKLFNEVQAEAEQFVPEEDDEKELPIEQNRDVDILNLPPRKEVHSENKNRARIKVSNASFRLITVIIIFLLLLGGAYYLWGENLLEFINRI